MGRRAHIRPENDGLAVGRGAAGVAAAETVARQGSAVTLIEEYSFCGGGSVAGLSRTVWDNVDGPEAVSVRKFATQFGEIFGIQSQLTGEEKQDCLFVNCDEAAAPFGNPVVPINPMVRWVAEWIKSGKPLYGKPSKFEVRSGVF